MKKRLLAMFLTSAMILGTISGCGSTESSKTDSSSKADTTTAGASDAADTTTAAGDTTTAAGDETTAAGDETTAEVTTTPANTVEGDESAKDAFYVWSWNTDIKNILDGPFKEAYPDDYKRIVYVNTGGSNYYQDKIDNIISTPDNQQYPDLMALEADYILKYTNSDKLTAIPDLGITADDLAQQYTYTQEIATNKAGKLMASSWQAAPGCWVVRKSLCEKYLGTTKLDEIQTYFATWDKVLETAEKVNKDSNGETKLLSGIDDVKRVYMAARTSAWYGTDDKIVMDPAMESYMDFAKSLYEKELTFNTAQWGDEWAANKKGDKVLAWPSCTWFTYWCLDSSNFGDYLMIPGPQEFYWGGTWLAATAGTSDKDLAAKIIKFITCDKDGMKAINKLNSDYVNNKAAIDELIAEGAVCKVDTDGDKVADKEVLADGQNFLEFFKPLADKISVKTMTGEDLTINSKFDVQVLEYSKGTKDKETAIKDFKASVVDTYSFLKAE